MESNIRLLHNNEIDLQRWDTAVLRAVNSRSYAFSWYLDILNPDWMGLIYGDYQYVMPLIVEKKIGVKLLIQPTYAQQHGIFPPSTPELTKAMISFLTKRFGYMKISFNSYNLVKLQIGNVEQRRNLILSLRKNYTELLANYTKHTKRYLKKAGEQLTVTTTITLEEYLGFKYKNSKKTLNKQLMHRLKLIIFHSLSTGQGIIYGAYDERNELCGAAFFLKEANRFTYLNSVSSPIGKQNRAMYAIIDSFIREHAEQPFLLDFEGSVIEGIARFFKGFGAKDEFYQHFSYSKWPLVHKILSHL